MSKGQIYCIENQINHKKYIGQTMRGINARWAMHQRDYQQSRCSHYPLYRAMNKYGVNNFICNLIEEVDEDKLDEREKYWIQYYDSYNSGYNCTLGGDGRPTVNVSDEQIMQEYSELHNVWKVADKLKIDHKTVSNRLKKMGVELKINSECSYSDEEIINCFNQLGQIKLVAEQLHISKNLVSDKIREAGIVLKNKGNHNGTSVQQFKNGELVATFPSLRKAAESLIACNFTKSKNPTSVAATLSKSLADGKEVAYGFTWKILKKKEDK